MANFLMDKLQVVRNENNELRQSLAKNQEFYEELKHENNFNRAKAVELKELLEIKGMDQVFEKLMTKSLENAEFALQIDKLNMELNRSNTCVENLGQERDGHKKMLLELSDVIRTLQSVDIDYKAMDPSDSYLRGQDIPLKNVKRKVEAIMADRKHLVSRCQQLEEENIQKDEKIAALEAQFHLLNSMNISDRSADEESGTISRTSTQDSDANSRTSSQEGSRNISRTSTQDSDTISRSSFQNDRNGIERTLSQDAPKYDDGRHYRMKKPWRDDVSVVSGGTAPPSEDEDSRYERKNHRSDEASCVSGATNPASGASCISSIHMNNISTFDDSEEVERLKNELAEANERHEKFKQLCQSAFSKMGNVEQELEESKRAFQMTASKRDEYKTNLRDVITQYKQLHDEYDLTIVKMDAMADAQVEHKERAAEVLMEEGLAGNVDDLINSYLRAGEKIVTLERKLAAAEREAEAAEQKKEVGDRKIRDAVAKHRKLDQEKESMRSKVSNAEEQMRSAKKEARKHKEEATHARRRLTTFLRKVDKLETDQDIAWGTNTELKATKQKVLDELPWSDDVLHRMMTTEATIVGKAWQERRMLVTDKQRLANENEELKAFCEEVLNSVGGQIVGQ
jgi:hypothetical protein